MNKNTNTKSLSSTQAYGGVAPVGAAAASKLSSSAVAPIVAVARGYETIQSREALEDFAERAGFADKRKRFYKEVRASAIGGHDILGMPWYGLDARNGDQFTPSEYQFRPSNPPEDDHGRPKKYLTAPGVLLPMDVHPATPASWLDKPDKILLAEGLLKGDSALSAYLEAMGATEELLACIGDNAREKLTDYMATLPKSDRVLIVRIASVTMFHKDAFFYNSIDFRGAEVWVGVDGDVSTNTMVWDQTRQVFDRLRKQKAEKVLLLSPTGSDDAKAGIDDFLATEGDWADLQAFKTPSLPQRPESEDEDLPVGSWRVSPDGTFCEAKCPIYEGENIVGYDWETVHDMGAKLVRYVVHRTPTRDEMRTGELDLNQESPDDRAEIRFGWKSNGDARYSTAVVPVRLLSESPRLWYKTSRAILPRALLSHPDFPRSDNHGFRLLEAALRGADKSETVIHWSRNGWVPVEGGNPVFIVGDDVIAADERTADNVRSGVDSRVVRAIDQYGIGGPADEYIQRPRRVLGNWDKNDEGVCDRFVPFSDAVEKIDQIHDDVEMIRDML